MLDTNLTNVTINERNSWSQQVKWLLVAAMSINTLGLIISFIDVMLTLGNPEGPPTDPHVKMTANEINITCALIALVVNNISEQLYATTSLASHRLKFTINDLGFYRIFRFHIKPSAFPYRELQFDKGFLSLRGFSASLRYLVDHSRFQMFLLVVFSATPSSSLPSP